MSDTTTNPHPENPYERPQTEAGELSSLSERTISETMLYYLKGAAPWLRFIGITGFIFSGLMALGIVAMMYGLGSVLAPYDDFGVLAAMGGGVFIIYLPFVAIYFFLSLFSFRFGGFIKRYVQSGNNQDLEEAFKNNKYLWTLYGVLLIIGLAFTALVVLILIIAAVLAVSGS